jgi:hypothetical protein
VIESKARGMKTNTREELKKIAIEVVNGRIFTSLSVDQDHLLPLVFMPLALLSKEDSLKLRNLPVEDQPGIFYAPLEKAGPRSINGLPIFWEVSWIVVGQCEEFLELCRKYQSELERVEGNL